MLTVFMLNVIMLSAEVPGLTMDYFDSILCIEVRYDEAGLNILSRTLIVKVTCKRS